MERSSHRPAFFPDIHAVNVEAVGVETLNRKPVRARVALGQKQKRKNMKRTVMKTSVALGALALTAIVAGAGNPNPKVLPPGSSPNGLTYGQWGAEWWKWVYAQPVTANPIQDPTGAFGQASQPGGHVWFLAGTFGEVVVRTNTIPTAKAIFF